VSRFYGPQCITSERMMMMMLMHLTWF